MFTATITRIKQFIGEVSPDQIGLCQKYFDAQGAPFYQVLSERDEVDANGELVAYNVTYDAKHGFRCTCPSGQIAFSNVRHASGTCKHVRFALACEDEVRKAMAGITREVEDSTEATEFDVDIVEAVMPKRISGAEESMSRLSKMGLLRGHEHASALYHGKYEADFRNNF